MAETEAASFDERAFPPGLYLLPAPLGPFDPALFAPRTLAALAACHFFFVENAKPARRFTGLTLRYLGIEKRAEDYDFVPVNEAPEMIARYLNQAKTVPAGLMSDAGAPGVADPGGSIVAAAHQIGVPVRPQTGASSLLLALAASGFNGQSFRFRGYLPRKEQDRQDALRQLERSASKGETQLFIETPYRNMALLASALGALKPQTGFCAACDLTLDTEEIIAAPVSKWRALPLPDFHKRPAVFLIGRPA